MEDEIDIRIESIKNQVEQAGEKLKKQLHEMKNEVLK